HRTVTRELLAVALGSRAVADGAVLRQPAGVPARPCVRLRVPIVLQELAELPQLLRQDDERALRPNGQHGDRLAAFSNGLGSCQEYWLLPVQCLLGGSAKGIQPGIELIAQSPFIVLRKRGSGGNLYFFGFIIGCGGLLS